MQAMSSAVQRMGGSFAQFKAGIGRQWGRVRAFSYGLKVAWVCVASSLLGLLLFTFAPQAQDLFLEVRGGFAIGILFWSGFYAGVLLLWVLPVYVSARWILSSLDNGLSARPDVKPVEGWVVRIVPPLLAMFCLTAILAGQLLALTNAPSPIDEFGAAKAKEFEAQLEAVCPKSLANTWQHVGCLAQNFDLTSKSALIQMSAATGTENVILIIYMVTLCIPIFFLIARFWFYLSAKWPFFGRFVLIVLAAWIAYPWVQPFLHRIGLTLTPLNFVVALYDLFASWMWLVFWSLLPAVLSMVRWRWLRVAGKVIWWFFTLLIGAIILLAMAVMLVGFIGNEIDAPLSLGHLALLPPLTLLLVYVTWWSLKPRTENFLLFIRSRLRLPVDPSDRAMTAERLCEYVFYAVLVISAAVLAILMFFHPVDVSDHVYRALLIPLFLGLLVPTLTWISRVSFRVHAPIIALVIVVLAISNLNWSEVNNVRMVEKSSVRPTLEASVGRWAAANHCALPTVQSPGNCPSPVIVSAAGGASRAAFLTATVIGKLMDGHPAPDGDMPPFAKQLFAISGVSGGSLGAAVTYAALADSQLADRATNGLGVPPCKKDAHDTEWFALHIDANRRPEKNWRDCLQRILSGDFLSPVFVNLIGNDILGFSLRGDRAAILENAWERRYAHMTGQSIAKGASTLDRSMVDLRNRVLFASPTSWLPILFLNGTSVTSGRRIVTSDIDTLLASMGTRSRGRLFRDAYDLHELFELPKRNFESASFSPDGKKLLTMIGGAAQLWDAETGTEERTFRDQAGGSLESARFSPDGRTIATAYDDIIRFWDTDSGTELGVIANQGDRATPDFEFSPNGQSLLTAHHDGTARLWDVASAKELRSFKAAGDDSSLQDAIFSPDSRHVLTGHGGDSARLWSVETGAEIWVIKIEGGAINRPTFSPDGRRLLSAASNTVTVWDVESGEKLRAIEHSTTRDEEFIKSLGFSPDGQLILTTTYGSAALWRVEDGAQLIHVLARDGTVHSATLSPNSTRLLIASGVFAELWDVATGVIIRDFKGQEGWVEGAAFSPDGRRVLTWSNNGTANLWDANTGAELSVISTSRGSMASCPRCDIRLSTAATMSARFPVISPHGNIRNAVDKVVDRVVDGGYFENFGAITALELANELKRFRLVPTVILINNEPATSGMQCMTYDSQLAYPKPPQEVWFPTIGAPLATVGGTRSARGSHAAVDLCSRLDTGNFAFVTVEPDKRNQTKALSMSWWLSKYVQKYLDDQVNIAMGSKNKPSFEAIEKWLARDVTQGMN